MKWIVIWKALVCHLEMEKSTGDIRRFEAELIGLKNDRQNRESNRGFQDFENQIPFTEIFKAQSEPS